MASNPLRIRVLDVGHGDSILIQFPDEVSYGIIDCNRFDKDLIKKGSGIKALDYFKLLVRNKRPPTVEFACVTHPHADHYSGFGALLNYFIKERIVVKEYWDFGPSVRKAQALASLARDAIQKRHLEELRTLCKAKYDLLRQGSKYRLLANPQTVLWDGQGVRITALAPSSEHFENYVNYLTLKSQSERREFLKQFPHSGNDNIVCSVFHIEFGKFSAVLASDLPNVGWVKLLGLETSAGGLSIRCDTLKVSHHGSLDGSFPNKEFICKYLKANSGPLTAVISGGYRANLPHKETLEALAEAGCVMFCTGRPQFCAMRPFRPDDVTDQDVMMLLEIDEVEEVTENVERGHGDIEISCYEDGTHKVVTECEFDSGPY